MRRVRVLVVAAAAFVAGGCAATSGSAWVREPDSGAFSAAEHGAAVGEQRLDGRNEPNSSPLIADVERAPLAGARPRLDRTVTLGEVDASYPERVPLASAAEYAPVSVTINNYVTTTPNGYYAAPFVAYPPGGGGSRPHPAPRTAPTQPGQDWPAIPSHGTSFPFKTAPASPWR